MITGRMIFTWMIVTAMSVTAVDAQTGYASGQEALAHIGLGKMNACDVEVVLPHGKGRIERKGVKANQRLTIH